MFSDIIQQTGQLNHPPFPPVSYSKPWKTKPSLLAICRFSKNEHLLKNPVCFTKFTSDPDPAKQITILLQSIIKIAGL